MLIGILALFLITFLIVSRIRSRLALFPELNYSKLRKEGKGIMRHFPRAEIRKIILYRYQSPKTLVYNPAEGKNHDFVRGSAIMTIAEGEKAPEPRYILVFYCKNPRAHAFRRCASIVNAIQDDIKRWGILGIGEGFSGIYRKAPPKNYLERWRFYVFTRHERALHINNRARWVVWPRLEL